jgi:hypothetical protein
MAFDSTQGADRLAWDATYDPTTAAWSSRASGVIVKEPGCFEFTVSGAAVRERIVVALA